ncbi:uncharacterized protein DUF1436 [Marinomonas alcarazii]|uniref:Uncharacterized protein DUF1436 n=1 Tax=Marinomonas alcarazii TaxID=491949 RepID=A0A318V7E5_9GAMM|nr:contact-dependent growth inhibition system immunity protein [Marinomonas alcarazii]PYF83983.1 uncharacterized protein DUF1436 [Marinomonas alcarazii]
MENDYKSAKVYFNQDIFYIITISSGGMSFSDFDAERYYHAKDVSNEKLGESIFKALRASRKITPESFLELFHSGVIQKRGEEETQYAINRFGYKNKRQLCRKMDGCGVSLTSNKIEITPTHHDSLEGYSSVKGQFESIFLSKDVSNEELGAAVREGLSRCTSSVK